MSEDRPKTVQARRPFRVDARGVCTGECGDSIEVMLELRKETIRRIAFRCDGCVSPFAAARGAAELAQNVPLDVALGITAVDVLEQLGGLGEEHEHCALIAVNAWRGEQKREGSK